MKRLAIVFGVGLWVLTLSVGSAQQPQGQGQAPAAQGQGQGQGGQGGGRGGRGQAPTNLQILPRDAQIGPIMQQFAASLGVQCNYCHVTAMDAAAPGGRGDGARGDGARGDGARGDGARAGGAGRGGRGAAPANDFASDAKIPKRTARTMMLMVRDINAKLAAELGKPAAEVTQVTCNTCHRGQAIPNAPLPPPPARGGQPPAAPAGGNAPAAPAQQQ